jgi:hypothetical protein
MSGNKTITIVTCLSCKKEIKPRGKSFIRAITCPECKSYFKIRISKEEKFSKFKDKFEPHLPIGAKGRIEGTIYEVMGFMVKREKYSYKWREYVLFNPYKGVAYLSEFDGHWNFIKPFSGSPIDSGLKDLTFFNGEIQYRLYQKYNPRVLYAEGEFLSDEVYIAEDSRVQEYIAPPYLFINQASDYKDEWMKGYYIESSVVAESFKLPKEKIPIKTGFGYTQPIIHSFTEATLIKALIGIVLLMIALQLLSTSESRKKVFSHTYNKNQLTEQKMFSTEGFLLEGTKSLQIEMDAPISNDWFYASFTLVNETTGTEYEFSKEIEYYHGVDDGESWSEGSTQGDAFLSRIPEGRYHINIYPEFSFYGEYFNINVYRNEPIYSNFFIALLVLALFPIFYFVRKHYKEQQRWSDSDYSPYDNG